MEPITNALLQYGIGGVFLAYLVWTIYLKQKQFDALLADYNKSQSDRIDENRRNAESLAGAAQAHRELAAAVQHSIGNQAMLSANIATLIERMAARRGGTR